MRNPTGSTGKTDREGRTLAYGRGGRRGGSEGARARAQPSPFLRYRCLGGVTLKEALGPASFPLERKPLHFLQRHQLTR